MNKFILALTALSGALLFSGCGHTPVRTSFPAALPPRMAETAVSTARSEALKKIIAPAKVRGVGFYPAAFEGHFTDEEVLNAIQASGFNRIYCQLTSEQEFNDRLAQFIAAAGKRNIPVEVVLFQSDFYRSYRTNRLMRPLMINYPDLVKAVNMLVKFNTEKLQGKTSIAGVTVVIEPQLFDHSNTERLKGKLYRWEDSRYGIGRDNDMLVRESMETVQKIAAIPALPPLTVAIPDFLHDAAAAGKLSCGKTADFLAYADQVAIVSSANLPSKVPASVSDELAAMQKKGKAVLVVIPLATHTSIEQGRLRRRNWNDFQRTVSNFMEKSADLPAFGGVIITPLAVIEYLRQEI